MSAMVKFREEYFKISRRPRGPDGKVNRAASDKPHWGLDVLRDCMTISSASMKHFRLNHLKENHLCIFPERGFDASDTQSLLALQFMDWYGKKEGVTIQTCNSAGGEKKVNFFYLLKTSSFRSGITNLMAGLRRGSSGLK